MANKLGRIGHEWAQAIRSPAFDLEENRRVFDAMVQGQELAAESILRDMRVSVVDGVQSCITRGSNSLALDLPQSVVGTEAFRAFSEWLGSENLVWGVANLPTEDTSGARIYIMPRELSISGI